MKPPVAYAIERIRGMAGPGPYEARQSDQSALAQSMAADVDPINAALASYWQGLSGQGQGGGWFGMNTVPQELRRLGDIRRQALASDNPLTGPEGMASMQALFDSPLAPGFGTMATVDDVARLARLADDLPMDEASRMARANEMFPIEAYHGTVSDFTEFERGDIGFHFGTPEQANKRLREVGKYAPPGAAANVIPARLNIRNPLEMKDVGEWRNPKAVAEALLETPIGRANADALYEIADESDNLAREFGDVDEWFASPEAAGFLEEMRSMVESGGFDGIRYLNEVENAFGNVADLTPEARALDRSLRAEMKSIQDAIAARRPPLPDVQTATSEDIQRWMEARPQPTPQEAARLDELTQELRRLSDTGRGDPYSYIALRPEQVRSRFARFDPRKIGSGDILASGAAGLLGLLAAGGNEAEAGQ